MDKVLIVDDEAIAIEYVLSLMNWQENGYEIVAITNSVKQAMSILSTTHVDIVLMDVMMPGMTGVDLSDFIHKDYPNVKMIAMSGYDDYDYVRQILLNGASDYILKHRLTSEMLLDALRKVSIELHRETSLSDSMWQVIKKLIVSGDTEKLCAYIKECMKEELQPDLLFSEIGENLLSYLDEDEKNDVLIMWQYYKSSIASPISRIEEDICYFSRIQKQSLVFNDYSIVVKKTMKFIEDMYSMNVTLDDAASIAGVNATYLSRLFHKETGRTFVEELTQIRVFNAKRMIRENHNIKKIALECGFKSYSYFFKVFRKQTGITPMEYLQIWEQVKILHY